MLTFYSYPFPLNNTQIWERGAGERKSIAPVFAKDDIILHYCACVFEAWS